jgi:hypothetical protein
MQKKIFLMLTLLITPPVFANTTPPLGFESPEHVTIGENVMLQFPDSPPSHGAALHCRIAWH